MASREFVCEGIAGVKVLGLGCGIAVGIAVGIAGGVLGGGHSVVSSFRVIRVLTGRLPTILYHKMIIKSKNVKLIIKKVPPPLQNAGWEEVGLVFFVVEQHLGAAGTNDDGGFNSLPVLTLVFGINPTGFFGLLDF